MCVQIFDKRYSHLFEDSKLVKLTNNIIWAEGPCYIPSEDAVLFSDVKGCKSYKYSEKYGLSIVRDPSDFANGNAITQDGKIITCQHGSRGLSVSDENGKSKIFLTEFEGKKFNSPNDVVVKSDGTIWFTDPPYGILTDKEGYKSSSEIIGCYVYCYNPQENKTYLSTFNTMRPNGLFFSPDEKQLYIADMSLVEFKSGTHELVVFDVDGFYLKNRRLVSKINPGIPDGFCVDIYGLIYCSCGDGILIITHSGELVAKITLNTTVSNCTLGGKKQNILYITASDLYKINLNTRGFQYDIVKA